MMEECLLILRARQVLLRELLQELLQERWQVRERL